MVPPTATKEDIQVSMPSRAYTSFLQARLFKKSNEKYKGVNALSGLYLISTLNQYP